jgi:ribulose-5-phosphate 4-epimerase/fuculose-1-phosphate aldolase
MATLTGLRYDDQTRDVRRRVTPEEWETRVDLAACYRLVAHYGWTDLIYNHISARVPGTEYYLLNPFGLLFDEISASSLVKVDLDGNIIDPTPYKIHAAGYIIHSAVHAARPDVGCVIHSHTRAGMALSILREGLLPLTQHAMLFYGKVAYHGTEGFALERDERRRIASDLGDKPVMILRNHGTLVAGATIAQAFSMAWHLEKAMQAQIDALATGCELTIPSPEVAAGIAERGFTQSRMAEYTDGKSPLGWLEWPALLRMLDRIDPSFRD